MKVCGIRYDSKLYLLYAPYLTTTQGQQFLNKTI